MSGIKIKQAEKGQESIVCEIHNESFSYWIRNLGLLYGYKNLEQKDVEKWLLGKNSFVFLAYYEKLPVGYVHCQLEEITGEEKLLRNLVFCETKESLGQSKIGVLSKYRRKNIAFSLVRNALGFSRQFDTDSALFLAYNKNQPVIRLLTKLGFDHKPMYFLDSFSKEKPFVQDSVLAEFDLSSELPNIQLNQEVKIRKILVEDLSSMQRIFGESRPDVFGTKPTLNQIKEWFDSEWGEVTLVAVIDGQVVGCMEFTSLGVIGIPGVLHEFRKQGIGSTLFFHLLQEMKNSGKKKALADTGFELQDAINMYKRFDFDLSRELWAWVNIL
ncbi:MAG: GNAT family N-acetyltransferase [Candidatus Heimdallarchaeota archaeon]|nr:GNAT family N-acetyltransferase [Candidatus Heimdallarchaeota archaeon]MBY8995581.1 GNAT family N-acetyltransferase [Candidatus Heimdallarchaeota archaeon]